jgi:hypothetical protein
LQMPRRMQQIKAWSRPQSAAIEPGLLMAPGVRVFRSVRDVAKADRCGKANRNYYRHSLS